MLESLISYTFSTSPLQSLVFLFYILNGSNLNLAFLPFMLIHSNIYDLPPNTIQSAQKCPGVLHHSPRRVTHVLVRLTGSRRLPSLAVIETSQKCGQGCVLSVSLLSGSWGSVVGERTCLMSALTRVLPLRGSCSKGSGQKQL